MYICIYIYIYIYILRYIEDILILMFFSYRFFRMEEFKFGDDLFEENDETAKNRKEQIQLASYVPKQCIDKVCFKS